MPLPFPSLPCTFPACTATFSPTVAKQEGFTGWTFGPDETDDLPQHDHTYEPRGILTLNIVGAGTVEVMAFQNIPHRPNTSVLLAWWSDQFVVWTIHKERDETGDGLSGAWDAEVGIYCSVDYNLALRSFSAKVERLS